MNTRCRIPAAVPLTLSDSVSLRTIISDDLSAITERNRSSSTDIRGGIFTLTIDPFDFNMSYSALALLISNAAFALNVVASKDPIVFGDTFVTKTTAKTTFVKLHNFNQHLPRPNNEYKLSPNTNIQDISSVFAATSAAINNDKSLQITISRFNSSVLRTSPYDRLIDMCISLESLADGNSDISFQFALYNAILSESDLNRRLDLFKILKSFYSARSKLVHGNHQDDAWIENNWATLIRVAKASILRKIEFFNERPQDNWQEYLQKIALGVPNA